MTCLTVIEGKSFGLSPRTRFLADIDFFSL
jgi:hypothetical protein